MTTPTAFGRYQIKGKLGRGGMAIVYHAYDPRFNRSVALKILPREFLFEHTFRARFDREARAIAALEHWAIVPVYDYGEEDDQPFLVMRYMPGGSLIERVAGGRLPLGEVIPIIDRIAAALDFAHRKDVIHRDVKPANILFDEEDNAYLSDFGIARLTESTMGLTGSGFVGTPTYVAPEMVRKGGITPLVDVYALGVTLYQVLAGKPPFEGDTPMGTALAHATEPIPYIGDCCPELPDAVQAVIEGALAKDPADRYPSAGALAAGLREAAAQAPQPEGGSQVNEFEPPAAYSPPVPEVTLPDAPSTAARMATPPRPTSPPRRGFPVWIAGVLGLVVVAGLAIAFWPRGGGTAEEPVAEVEPAVEPTVEEEVTAEPTVEEQPAEEPSFVPALSADDCRSAELPSAACTGVGRNAGWIPHTETINGVQMALVPAGCFQMGSEDGSANEQPIHEVCFEEPFWIDVYEVTIGQFADFGGVAEAESGWTESNRPRENISWMESDAFCDLRGARLPTEAEWEYAARGPDNLVFPWGNDFVAENVVYVDNAGSETWDVGSKLRGMSWIGAYDLSGNVWEWVNDWYGGYSSARQVNPQGPGSGEKRVQRGGAWGESMYYVRAAYRGASDPSAAFYNFGFRCALSFDPGS
jgi:formylglycine-generating enzyme required for sulfatase activity